MSDIVHDGHAVRVERDRLGRELSRKSGDLLLEHHYDALDRLLEQRLTHATGAVDRSTGAAPALVQRNYRYDASGRLAELKDTRWGRTQYRHDPIGQLVSVISDRHQEAFDYDVTGSLQNVLSRLEDASQTTPWRVGKGNLLEERPGEEPGSRILYENDTAGRRTRKTERAADGTTATTTYHYDHGGRLREVRLPDSSIARYRYDAFTRRIEKKLIPKERADVARAFVITAVTGTAPALPTTTRFVYDGGALCAELRRDGATGALTAERVHVHLPKSLTPLLQIEGGQLYTVITDHLGAPRELVDTHGRIAWTAHCSGWGNLLAETREASAAVVRSPFRLLGQYDDEETGLCYTRFRYFDAHTARWLTPDPLGFDGGRNLLAFDGSPIAEVDPWGLACEKATGDLDWSGTDPMGRTRREHVALHGEDNPNKQVHGVFADDPIATTEEAWAKAKQQGIVPVEQANGNNIYDVPFPNAGLQGGQTGNAEILDRVSIVTKPTNNEVVTAFPS